jgi:voltage-gated sodium channel
MQEFFKKIAASAWFQNFITAVILLAGVLVGLETYPGLVERHHSALHIGDQIILWIFVVEIVVKMAAEGKKPWRYFLDPWNVFDFIIVAACFLPFEGNAVTVLRLLRLLRVLKLVKALPKLQILVGALLKSIPSMVYVSVLLFLLFYVYAVAAVFLFGENDPLHFTNLETAMLSLFRVVTLEDWTDLMYINMYGCDRYGYGPDSVVLCSAPKAQPVLAALYFVSFVLTGTMIILNLFIGVIMSGMDEAQAEAADLLAAAAPGAAPTVASEVDALQRELEAMQARLGSLSRMIDKQRE